MGGAAQLGEVGCGYQHVDVLGRPGEAVDREGQGSTDGILHARGVERVDESRELGKEIHLPVQGSISASRPGGGRSG